MADLALIALRRLRLIRETCWSCSPNSWKTLKLFLHLYDLNPESVILGLSINNAHFSITFSAFGNLSQSSERIGLPTTTRNLETASKPFPIKFSRLTQIGSPIVGPSNNFLWLLSPNFAVAKPSKIVGSPIPKRSSLREF